MLTIAWLRSSAPLPQERNVAGEYFKDGSGGESIRLNLDMTYAKIERDMFGELDQETGGWQLDGHVVRLISDNTFFDVEVEAVYAGGHLFLPDFLAMSKWTQHSSGGAKAETSDGVIAGRVTSGATTGALLGIRGAEICLDPNPLADSVFSEEQGDFNVRIPAGEYDITVSADEFETKLMKGVTVGADETTVLTVELAPLNQTRAAFAGGQIVVTDTEAVVFSSSEPRSKEVANLIAGSVLEIVEHPENGEGTLDEEMFLVKFGSQFGWVRESEIRPYDTNDLKGLGETVKFTAYHVALESDLIGGATVEDPKGLTGGFSQEFLYSARGVCMQGSGVALDGTIIKYSHGGAGWINSDHEPTAAIPGTTDWTNGSPFWISDESTVVFYVQRGQFIEGFGATVYPWYSVAVDDKTIPLGSVVYVEELDGRVVDGVALNGYMMAVDTGGAIKGARADVYTGFAHPIESGWGDFFGSLLYSPPDSSWKIGRVDLHSPAELRVIDPTGRITGLVDGAVVRSIPYSTYDQSSESVLLMLASDFDSYNYEVAGTADGIYGLTIAVREGSEVSEIELARVSTSDGAIHRYSADWSSLRREARGIERRTDQDGDGYFEQAVTMEDEIELRFYVVGGEQTQAVSRSEDEPSSQHTGSMDSARAPEPPGAFKALPMRRVVIIPAALLGATLLAVLIIAIRTRRRS